MGLVGLSVRKGRKRLPVSGIGNVAGLVTDDFNRADVAISANGAGAASNGAVWTGQCGISNGQMILGGAVTLVHGVQTCGRRELDVTIPSGVTADFIITAEAANGNGILLIHNSSGFTMYYRKDGATSGNTTAAALSSGATYKLIVTTNGRMLNLYLGNTSGAPIASNSTNVDLDPMPKTYLDENTTGRVLKFDNFRAVA